VRVGIISNIKAAIGLARDFEILRDLLVDLGHEVIGIQYDEPEPTDLPCLDLAMFLEVLPVDMLRIAPVNWYWGNAEWVRPEMVKLIERHCDKVFAKTHEAQRIFEPLWPGKVFYTGFAARDRFDETATQEDFFLVLAGNSQIRGAQECIDAWHWTHNGKRIEAPLYVVARCPLTSVEDDRIHRFTEVPDTMLRELQNTCRFHLHLSQTEGWGHSLHESLSVGAEIIIPDSPPMNELVCADRIPTVGKSKFHLADLYQVSAIDIYKAAVEHLEFRAIGRARGPRDEFLRLNAEFKEAFAAHLQDIGPKRTPRKKSSDVLDIAFIGNFQNPDSTENMIQWALTEGLGHQVEKLQENAVRLHDIREAAEFSDLFIWVRTPTFLKVPNEQMEEFLSRLRIPSAGLHLDKFFGIPEREALIGKIPFWKCKYVFTADGSRQDDFRSRGVNHFYMPPAASIVYSHPGIPREEYLCDVGFVGAHHGYHSEHPFRNQLIDFLESTYGDRFKLIEGLRGHGLNDFYASCKVCVADCFGGGKIPYYTSDRMVETPMRHGFLLSPKIEGMTIPLATFEPENLTDLHKQIEYWLSHEKERLAVKFDCADHVRRHDTWTERLRMVLSTMGFETGWLW
jgi:hypothetical protein